MEVLLRLSSCLSTELARLRPLHILQLLETLLLVGSHGGLGHSIFFRFAVGRAWGLGISTGPCRAVGSSMGLVGEPTLVGSDKTVLVLLGLGNFMLLCLSLFV
jgi:hypothetical protein